MNDNETLFGGGDDLGDGWAEQVNGDNQPIFPGDKPATNGYAARIVEVKPAGAARLNGDAAAKVRSEFALEAMRKLKSGSKKQQAEGDRPRADKSTAAGIEALRDMGFTIEWNEVDSRPEINGAPMERMTDSIVYNKMYDAGWTNATRVENIIIQTAGENSFHPVKRAIENVTWDGNDHIGRLGKYIKDAHLPLNGEPTFIVFLRRWLVGAVAKLYRPDAQNFCFVWDGAQGRGKSRLAKWIGSPFTGRYCEQRIDLDRGRQLTERAATEKFVWEIPEIQATTNKADVSALKAFLTQQTFTFKIPWDKYMVTKPALASYIGTMNDDGTGFLRDVTGDRRFVCVDLTGINWEYENDIDPRQVWAQAYSLYKSGFRPELSDEEVRRRSENNEKYRMERPFDEVMDNMFVTDATKADSDATDWRISPHLIGLALVKQGYSREQRSAQMEAAAWLKRMGCKKRGKPPTWRGVTWRSDSDSAKYEAMAKGDQE